MRYMVVPGKEDEVPSDLYLSLGCHKDDVIVFQYPQRPLGWLWRFLGWAFPTMQGAEAQLMQAIMGQATPFILIGFGKGATLTHELLCVFSRQKKGDGLGYNNLIQYYTAGSPDNVLVGDIGGIEWSNLWSIGDPASGKIQGANQNFMFKFGRDLGRYCECVRYLAK